MMLGVVQGLTEFLPVSSSGHLVVVETAFGLPTPGVLVEVVLHVGTLLAVFVVYRKRLWQLIAGACRGDRGEWRYVGLLAIGTVPAALVGSLLTGWIERVFESLIAVGIDFILTAIILWSTRWVRPASAAEPSSMAAGGIGVAQALALFPGISRSGSTIAAATWLGVEPVKAAEYSFLLAIPAIAGAGLQQVPSLSTDALSVGLGSLTLGFLVALASGIFAIRALVVLLKWGCFHRFAPYCFTLGAVTLAWELLA
ncbi:MAG: undecaprenyl-diphosphate phosphatase [Gemmatimonadota bacterium]|nr:MAG: undecaprenyl-diphosphate phosphatase [Gemmatimonadota bacterium]